MSTPTSTGQSIDATMQFPTSNKREDYTEAERIINLNKTIPSPLYVIVHSHCDHGVKLPFDIFAVLPHGFQGSSLRIPVNRPGRVFPESIVELEGPVFTEDMKIVMEASVQMPDVAAVGCSRDRTEASVILREEALKFAEKRKSELVEKSTAEAIQQGMNDIETEVFVKACSTPVMEWRYTKDLSLEQAKFVYKGDVGSRKREMHWWEVVYVNLADHTFIYSKHAPPTA